MSVRLRFVARLKPLVSAVHLILGRPDRVLFMLV